ncbi:MAG: heme ABC transporter ATP-binding protein [Oceanobacter sp.]
MLVAQELSYRIGNRYLLQPLNLVVHPGERVALLGANGAGKSTLLSCISGDVSHYGGQIWMASHDLARCPRAYRAQHLAVMPQKVELAFPFTAHQVVLMGRAPHGDEKTTRHWQQQVMELTQVWHLRDRSYSRLSGGEQQRVQLARVLLQIWDATSDQADGEYYLLLDECTSALDPAHQHTVMNAVSQLCQHRIGILAVMHDVALAASWADRVMLLKDGRMIASGSVDLLTSSALMEQCYDLPEELAWQYARSNQNWLDSRRA